MNSWLSFAWWIRSTNGYPVTWLVSDDLRWGIMAFFWFDANPGQRVYRQDSKALLWLASFWIVDGSFNAYFYRRSELKRKKKPVALKEVHPVRSSTIQLAPAICRDENTHLCRRLKTRHRLASQMNIDLYKNKIKSSTIHLVKSHSGWFSTTIILWQLFNALTSKRPQWQTQQQQKEKKNRITQVFSSTLTIISQPSFAINQFTASWPQFVSH